jgi:hypothetical protein
MRILVVTDHGVTVEIRSEELRQHAARLLAEVAADLGGDQPAELAKRRGRPPGGKPKPAEPAADADGDTPASPTSLR